MVKRNTGKEYEILVHQIYSVLAKQTPGAIVKLDEKIEGPDGPRQVDITIRYNMVGAEYLTAIECRDYGRPLDVKNIDGFASKLTDIKASKGIMVTRIGYSKNAMQKANRLGVDLVIADKPANLQKVNYQSVPVLFCRVTVSAISPMFRLAKSLPPSISFKRDFSMNGIPAVSILLDAFRRGLVGDVQANGDISAYLAACPPRVPERNAFVDLAEFFGDTSVWVEDNAGEKHIVSEPALLFSLEYKWNFGHVHDMETALQTIDVKKGETQVVFQADELNTLDAQLVSIRSPEEIPNYAKNYGLKILVIDSISPPDGLTLWVLRDVGHAALPTAKPGGA